MFRNVLFITMKPDKKSAA